MGGSVKVVVLGAAVASVARELSAADVEEVIALEHPALAEYTSSGYVQALVGLMAAEGPSHVILPHTYPHARFAPRLAARLDRALAADCVGVKPHEGILRLHPSNVSREGPRRRRARGRSAASRDDPGWGVPRRCRQHGHGPAATRSVSATVDASAIRERPEPLFREARQAVDLSQAERIVAVGRGIKGKEHLPLAETLAKALDAELAASRPICDAGWLPMERQVGSSGQTVAPKLYVALGILRRHPARRRDEGRPHDRRDQQGLRRADLRDRRLRHPGRLV